MKDCEYYQELICALEDGEVSNAEYKEIIAHIEDCPRCSAVFTVFSSLSDIIAEDTEELPEGLHENIMAGVRRSEMLRRNKTARSKFKISKSTRNALTAAACAAVVILAVTGLGFNSKKESKLISAEEAAAIQADTVNTAKPAEQTAVVAADSPAPAESPAQSAMPAQAAQPAVTPAPAAAPATQQGRDIYSGEPTQIPEPARTPVQQTQAPVQVTAAPQPVQSVSDPVRITAPPVQTAAPAPQSVGRPAKTAESEAAAANQQAAAPSREAQPSPAPAAEAQQTPAPTVKPQETPSPAAEPQETPSPAAEAQESAVPEEAEKSKTGKFFSGIRALFAPPPAEEEPAASPDSEMLAPEESVTDDKSAAELPAETAGVIAPAENEQQPEELYEAEPEAQPEELHEAEPEAQPEEQLEAEPEAQPEELYEAVPEEQYESVQEAQSDELYSAESDALPEESYTAEAEESAEESYAAEPEAQPAPESAAETDTAEQAEAEPEASPAPAKDKSTRAEIKDAKAKKEFETLLEGREEKLPDEKCLKVYDVALLPENTKDETVIYRVRVFEDSVFYTKMLPKPQDTSAPEVSADPEQPAEPDAKADAADAKLTEGTYFKAACSAADFEKHIMSYVIPEPTASPVPDKAAVSDERNADEPGDR